VDNGAVFLGAQSGVQPHTKTFASFESPVIARFVRLTVVESYDHASLRWAVVVVSGLPITINPLEASRTYSSVWDNNAIGTGHARSTLDSDQAWSALRNEAGQWTQADLGSIMLIDRIITMPRKTSPWQGQRVTKFTVQVSNDNWAWTNVDNKATFLGPAVGTDPESKTVAVFAAPVLARFVRIVVVEWSEHISLRWGVGAVGGPLTSINYFSTNMGDQGDIDKNRLFIEDKFTKGDTGSAAYCSRALQSLDVHSNHGVCPGGSNSNFGQRFEVRFVETVANTEWKFRINLDAGFGFVAYLDGVEKTRRAGDIWQPGTAIEVALGGVSAGQHVFTVYGAEGCCDGEAGAWTFVRGNAAAVLVSLDELQRTNALGAGTCRSTAQEMVGADVKLVQFVGATDAEKDASCCAQCRAEPACQYWVRSYNENSTNCWLKKNFVRYAGSAVRRGAMRS